MTFQALGDMAFHWDVARPVSAGTPHRGHQMGIFRSGNSFSKIAFLQNSLDFFPIINIGGKRK
jgi:hypothetical protein